MPATRKSFKESARDKPKHSIKDIASTKKGGAGGKGTWGTCKDDVKYMEEDGHAFDNADPNFDPVDQREGRYSLSVYTPTDASKQSFSNGMSDLVAFKRGVKDACKEFLVSHDFKEFKECVKDAQYFLFHQDLPAILVKYSLDKDEKDRKMICQLLLSLSKEKVITVKQMSQGFRKLFQGIDDLVPDAPNAKVILSEFVGHGQAAGYLDSTAIADMEKEALDLAEFPALKGTKAKISSAVKEFLTSNELGEFERSLQEIKPCLQFEAVKKLISVALDLTNAERERTNVALAALVGSTITQHQMEKGVTILLGRVEDLYLDVPDVLHLLSCIIARAVTDEALPPSFLLRLDLAEGDMGFQVATHAQHLLDQDKAASKLEHVWGV